MDPAEPGPGHRFDDLLPAITHEGIALAWLAAGGSKCK